MHVLKRRHHVHVTKLPYFSSCTDVDGRDDGLVGAKRLGTCEAGGWTDVCSFVGGVGAG